ncbi:hypothetical protein [Streptomyces sp. NPDC051000]|uniref:hypothetical protein n=1 Tax=Streptomyces sp. NPDC051000 TaxID=3155520 RepID=UPI003402CEDE
MTLSTLYAFLRHDVLGNVLAALLVAGLGYPARKILAEVRNRNRDTDHTDDTEHSDDSDDTEHSDDSDHPDDRDRPDGSGHAPS